MDSNTFQSNPINSTKLKEGLGPVTTKIVAAKMVVAAAAAAK